MKLERRIYQVPDIEYRVHGEGDERQPVVSGLGVPYDMETVIGGMFREEFVAGAFKTAIADDDIRSLFNHDPNIIFGRNKAGTLDLAETSRGVVYTARPDLNPTTEGPLRNIERGEVSGSSFGFMVREEEWPPQEDGSLPLRRVRDASMADIGPVTFPAYQQTDATVARSLMDNPNIPERAIRAMAPAWRCAMGKEEQRGARLSSLLNRLVDSNAGDGPRSEVIQDMASAAGIDASTVTEILNGRIDCPPLNRLQGFARALGTSLSRLQSAAEGDGCEYGDDDRCTVTNAEFADIRRRIDILEKA